MALGQTTGPILFTCSPRTGTETGTNGYHSHFRLRLHVPSTSPFSVTFSVGFNAVLWSCLDLAPKSPKMPLTKTVTLTVCVNKPLVTVEFPSVVTPTGFQHKREAYLAPLLV